MKRTIDGAYVLCGANYSGGTYNGYVSKIDTMGNIIWEKVYPALLTLDILKIEPAIDGGFILGGQKKDYPGGPQTAYLAKINDTGSIVWQKQYILSLSNIVSGIQAKNNGYIIAGWSNDKVYLLKTNLYGDSIDAKIFTNTSNVYDGPILLKENNNKYYLAHINSYVSRLYSVDSNFNTIRQVELQASQNINSLWLFSLIRITNSNTGDIIAVGSSDYYTFGNADVYAARLDSSLFPPPPIGILNQLTTITDDFFLLQNYPNPFNPETKISFDLPKDMDIKLTVYDVLGREIYSINEFRKSGGNMITFDGTNLASGVYYYSLEAGTFAETKKMVLIK